MKNATNNQNAKPTCPKCGSQLEEITERFGYFWECPSTTHRLYQIKRETPPYITAARTYTPLTPQQHEQLTARYEAKNKAA